MIAAPSRLLFASPNSLAFFLSKALTVNEDLEKGREGQMNIGLKALPQLRLPVMKQMRRSSRHHQLGSPSPFVRSA